MSKNTFDIYHILEKIRHRPAMYIGDETLENLRSFLAGYSMAMNEHKKEDASQPRFSDFHEWVREYYGYYESTAGWANMILAVVLRLEPQTISWENYDKGVTFEQHRESVRTFYALLDEYRSN